MQVKICGIKDIEAAKASIENNADYLGFNFIQASKRLISPEDSQNIVSNIRNEYPKKKFKCVGLFDKELFSEAENIVESTSSENEISFSQEAVASQDNELSDDLKEFGVDTDEPDLFNNEHNVSGSDDLLGSSENEEDDLEIPAFLRRQKN